MLQKVSQILHFFHFFPDLSFFQKQDWFDLWLADNTISGLCIVVNDNKSYNLGCPWGMVHIFLPLEI